MTKKISKTKVVTQFSKACDALADAVNQHLFEGCRDWYWIGDDVGGIADFDNCDFLTPSEMRLILEYNMTYDEYAEWRDASLDYNSAREECDKYYINLHSWLMGARYEIIKDNE